MPQILHPSNDTAWHALRAMDITSTESAALFGMSPYATRFELWHRKKAGQILQIEENERMRWGTRLQDAIARGIAEDCGIKVRKLNAYMRHNHSRMGASFDFEVVGVDTTVTDYVATLADMYTAHGPGVLEIKNVDSLIFRDQWVKNEDGTYEAPEHIELQLQHQLHVVDRDWGVIAAMVGGNRPVIITRLRDEHVGGAVQAQVDAFWQSIESNQPPAPDFRLDADTISKMYGFADPGKVFDARNDETVTSLCARYRELADAEKNAEEEKKAVKAQLLTLIGDAEKVLANGFTISAGVVGPAEVAYTRAAYRNFRITAKKAAKVEV